MDNQFFKKVTRFLGSEDGPTAVEYAFMLAFIVLAAFTAIVALGQASSDSFEEASRKMPGK